MIVIPSIELRGGVVVLPGGRQAAAADAARAWVDDGFCRLHVIDGDVVAGTGSNAALVDDLVRDAGVEVEVAADIGSAERVQELVDAGARLIVVGDRGLDEPQWLGNLAGVFPATIVVAADVRERRVMTRGWVRTLAHDIFDVVAELNGLALGGFLLATNGADGRLGASDLALIEDVADAMEIPLFVCSPVESMSDLRALENRGVAGVIVGAPLHSGALDARAVAREFGE
jgi:phosphoribosylformimino-5-aminoimidazole carboxamide ribotide isomerase